MIVIPVATITYLYILKKNTSSLKPS